MVMWTNRKYREEKEGKILCHFFSDKGVLIPTCFWSMSTQLWGVFYFISYSLLGACLFISYRFITYTLTLHNEITLYMLSVTDCQVFILIISGCSWCARYIVHELPIIIAMTRHVITRCNTSICYTALNYSHFRRLTFVVVFIFKKSL